MRPRRRARQEFAGTIVQMLFEHLSVSGVHDGSLRKRSAGRLHDGCDFDRILVAAGQGAVVAVGRLEFGEPHRVEQPLRLDRHELLRGAAGGLRVLRKIHRRRLVALHPEPKQLFI
jgi:hypothetical protein